MTPILNWRAYNIIDVKKNIDVRIYPCSTSFKMGVTLEIGFYTQEISPFSNHQHSCHCWVMRGGRVIFTFIEVIK